jgi:hypothetical protein
MLYVTMGLFYWIEEHLENTLKQFFKKFKNVFLCSLSM